MGFSTILATRLSGPLHAARESDIAVTDLSASLEEHPSNAPVLRVETTKATGPTVDL